MDNALWNAQLNPASPRYRDWKYVLGDEGDDHVPLLAPHTFRATLGEEKDVEVYLLDWQNLDEDQSHRLLKFLCHKFRTDIKVIQADLDRDGHFPIRAADVIVAYSLRAFL